MKLIDILQKMKVNELKKEISKQNIKGYSKLKKAEIIKIIIDRPDKFKYLLLQNMEQKKEILQSKVKLKEVKEKMKKLTAKKIPAKKAQQAEVIKPKPKREPMIPKIIKTKTGVVTVKPKKEEPKPAPKKELTKDEIKIKTFEKEIKTLKVKIDQSPSPITKKNIDISEREKRQKYRDKLTTEIKELEFKIFFIKEKEKDKEKDKIKKNKIKKEKDEKKEFRSIVEEFIKKPSDELLEKIEKNYELLGDLPQKLEEKAENAIEKYLTKDKKTEEPKKEKLKDCPAENHELKFTKDYKDFLKQSRTVHPDKNKGCVELAKKMFQQLQIHYSKYKNPTLREIANIVKNFEYTVKEREDGKVIIELDKKSSKSIKKNELQDLRNKLKQLNPNYRIMQKM